MKRYKKLLTFVLFYLMVLGFAITVNAEEEVLNEDSMYIYSKEVPNEVITYTQSNIGEVLQATYSTNTYTVGTPFTLEGHSGDLYYFMVYDDDKIIGFYRVYEDETGKYAGIYSENELFINNIADLYTTSDAPARIVVGDYEDIYAVVNNKVNTLLPDYEGRSTEIIIGSQVYSISNEYSIIDINRRIEIESPIIPRATTSKYLSISRSETQGSEPWCAAYVTAGICRYVTGRSNIYARTVMEWAYPNLSNSELEDQSLSRTKAIAYANTLGLSPTQSSSRLSWSRIVSEINADRPLYFGCDNLSGGSAHAVLCRGYYKATNSYYSIWNPHGTSYETLNASTYIYQTTSGTQYKYARTIYSWT